MSGATPCERTVWNLEFKGGRKRVRDVPTWAKRHQATAPARALGGAPWRTENVLMLCRNGRGDAMRTHPVGPSVEPLGAGKV
eukprot:5924669-Pyramimonas_sp.AAC.1